MHARFLMPLLFVLFSSLPCLAETSQTLPEIWAGYDPDAGKWKEEVVHESVKDGVLNRETYLSAWVCGKEIRVYCKYSVKDGLRKAPGLLNVHGWMGAPNIDKSYVDEGWAVMAFDYCGESGKRVHFTKYPKVLDHGNMDAKFGRCIWSKLREGKSITDPKQTSDYLWYAVQRRVLSYLLKQKEVDDTRIGAKGYSYDGTIMWNLGMDPRVKAMVAYFGIGWNEYYRSKGVWMYNQPFVEPPKSPGEIKGFRSTNNRRGSGTEQLADPKWQAPEGTDLGFDFYCTQPVTLTLVAENHYEGTIEITASDDWQKMIVDRKSLLNRFSKKPLSSWDKVGRIKFLPKDGSDITKVIFSEFRWVKSKN